MGRAATVGFVVAGSILIGAVGFFAWIAWGPNAPSSTPLPATQPLDTSHHDAAEPRLAAREGRTFTDPLGGYRLSVPKAWQVKDRSGGTHMIRADFGRGEIGFQVRVLRQVGTTRTEDFLAGYVDRFVRDMEGHWGGKVERHDVDCRPLGATPGCRVSLSQPRGNGQAYWLGQYVWLHDGTAVVFQAGAPQSAQLQAKAQIDEIAASFAWTR